MFGRPLKKKMELYVLLIYFGKYIKALRVLFESISFSMTLKDTVKRYSFSGSCGSIIFPSLCTLIYGLSVVYALYTFPERASQ